MLDPTFDFPGWSTAVDPRTGRQYFINMQEKTTTWEDPRVKYKPVYGQSIALQNMHGSPKKNVQVYPTQSYPVQAFQSYPGQSSNASPIPSTKTNYSHTVEMSSLSRSSPHTPRIGSLIKNHQQLLQQQTQETSFTTPTPMETEATVAKINTMFPTASEHHIRLLLKKYHNREAVVISALQVEKHPLTTPGPYTPPVQRSFHTTAMALSGFATPPSSTTFGRKSVHHLHGDHMTIASSSNGSPIPMRPQSSSSVYTTATTMMYGSPRFGEQQHRSSPKPHSSPKMKLRYLKSMFPKADEAMILDVLANVDNNVQKASEQLVRMGYEKKEMTPAPRLSHRKKEEHQPKKETIEPTPPPKPKTADEKKKLKARLQSQYKDAIPEKIIAMALESVDYSEEKALRILDIVQQEDKESKKKSDKDKKKSEHVSFKEPGNVAVVARRDEVCGPKAKSVMLDGLKDDKFLSLFSKSNIAGPNVGLAKGPRDELLLTDYVTWNGANPDIIKGRRAQASGPNASLRIERSYTPRGRSSELCKGAKIGLAKGSMYSQLARPNVACN